MSVKLQNLKCKPCSVNTPKLNFNQINDNLKKLVNWNINEEGKMIFKKYKFKSFNDFLKFVNTIGQIADEQSHHPDISLGFGYCLVMIHTHAIKGLSINDFILASKIDLLSF